MSKNNFSELIRKQEPHQQRFTIKKLTVGVASVLLGFVFMGMAASADTVDNNQSIATSERNQQVVSTDASKNVVVPNPSPVVAAPQTNVNINVPRGFDQAFATYAQNPSETNRQRLVQLCDQGIRENGGFVSRNHKGFFNDGSGAGSTFVHNAADQRVVIPDQNNLDNQTRESLNNYAAGVINQLRAKMPMSSDGMIYVSPATAEFGKMMADGYTKFGLTFNHFEHDMSISASVARQMGINDWVGENLSLSTVTHSINGYQTLDGLKEMVYDAILNFIFGDTMAGFGHASALINNKDMGNHIDNKQFLSVTTCGPQGALVFNFIPVTSNCGSDVVNEFAKGATTGTTNSHYVDQSANVGHLDGVSVERSANGKAEIKVTGWQAAQTSKSQKNRWLILFDQTLNRELSRVRATAVQRNDVYNAYPTINNSRHSGYTGTFAIDPRYLSDQFKVIARYSNDPLSGEGQHTDFWSAPVNFDRGNYGALDSMTIANGKLHVAGWQASNQAANKPYHYLIVWNKSQNREITRARVNLGTRQDVANAYPTIFNAGVAGFDHDFNIVPGMNDEIQIISRWTNDAKGNGSATDYWFSPQRLFSDQGNYASLDSVSGSKGQVTVSGWHASNQAIGKKYHFIIALVNGREVDRQLIKNGVRNDVAQAFPGVMGAGNSGFVASFKSTATMANGNVQFVSRWTSDPAGNGNATDYWFAPINTSNNQANLDSWKVNGNSLLASGWHATDKSIFESYRTQILFDNTANHEVARQNVLSTSRPDVQKAFADMRNASNSGFKTTFTGINFVPGHDYSIIDRYSLTSNANNNYTDQWLHIGVVKKNTSPVQLSQSGSRDEIVNHNIEKAFAIDSFKYEGPFNYASADNVNYYKYHVKGWMASNWLAEKDYPDWWTFWVNNVFSPSRMPFLILLKNGKELAKITAIPWGEGIPPLFERPDVAAAYPEIWDSKNSGFDRSFLIDQPVDHNANYQVQLVFGYPTYSDDHRNTEYIVDPVSGAKILNHESGTGIKDGDVMTSGVYHL